MKISSEIRELDPNFYKASDVCLDLKGAPVRDVWGFNLYYEFMQMLEVAKTHKFIAMDTEYPGTVVTIPTTKTVNIFHYANVSANVNLLKLIQLGLSFFNDNGEQPTPAHTWQFNFKFCPSLDMSSIESLNMLIDAGFDFQRHDEEGIDLNIFAELFYSSNLLMNPKIRWITFHGSSDFCYLVKMLINTNLPHQEAKFYPLLNTFFPRLYDIKYIIRDCRDLNGGLQHICQFLQIETEGVAHHAGSDSVNTGKLFFKIISKYFENQILDEKYSGRLYGCENHNALKYLKNFYGESNAPKIFEIKINTEETTEE